MMSFPSDVPTLVKSSKSKAEADEFLAFLNLGKKTEQKSAEDKGTEAEIEKQKLEKGPSWGNAKQSDLRLARGRAGPWPDQKRTLFEKRKQEDTARWTEREGEKKVVATHGDTAPGDSRLHVKWDLNAAPPNVKPPSWRDRVGPKATTNQENSLSPELSTSASFSLKNLEPSTRWLNGLGHTEMKDAVGAKDSTTVLVSIQNLTKETDATGDAALPAQGQQEKDTAADATASSSGDKVDQGEQAHDQAPDHSQSSSGDESPLTPDEEIIIIDPEGDLRVTIRTIGKELTALCSSPCLRRASPKWRALIQASPTEIHLEEDPEMVLVLLRIAHAQFVGLPTHTFFNELLEFARICHVYETTELVSPWLHAWVDPWARKALDPGYEGFIFIAWIFGYMDTFEALTHRLASTATSSEGDIPDEVLDMFNLELRTTIAENILRVRNAVLSDIISICHSQVNSLSDVGSPKACWAESEYQTEDVMHSELCDCIALGSLQRGLKTIGIWPPYPAPDTSRMTIQGLQNQLDELTILSYPGHEEYHDFCCGNENFHNALHLKRKEVSALQVAHKEHFESFGATVPRNDPLIWKSKAVENMGFLERDLRSHDSDSEADETFPDPDPEPEDGDEDNDDGEEPYPGLDAGEEYNNPRNGEETAFDPHAEEYNEDEDENYEESDSDSDSELDEEYLEPGEENDYTSDVGEDEPVEEQSNWASSVSS